MFSPDSIRSMSDLAMFAKGRSDFMHDKVLKDLKWHSTYLSDDEIYLYAVGFI